MEVLAEKRGQLFEWDEFHPVVQIDVSARCPKAYAWK